MREVKFTVDGIPRTKGDKTPGRRNDGTLYVRERGGRELTVWMRAVRETAKLHRLDVIRQSPLFLGVTFWIHEPPQHAIAGDWAPVKPDFDKLVRAICDALVQAKCMVDDAQVVDSRIRKRYGRPGCRIILRDAGSPRAVEPATLSPSVS